MDSLRLTVMRLWPTALWCRWEYLFIGKYYKHLAPLCFRSAENFPTTGNPWDGSCRPLCWRRRASRSTMSTTTSSAIRTRYGPTIYNKVLRDSYEWLQKQWSILLNITVIETQCVCSDVDRIQAVCSSSLYVHCAHHWFLNLTQHNSAFLLTGFWRDHWGHWLWQHRGPDPRDEGECRGDCSGGCRQGEGPCASCRDDQGAEESRYWQIRHEYWGHVTNSDQ